MMHPTVSATFLLAASPFVGSFLGLVIERLPAGEPIVLGRSRCASCGHALGPRDLVPLLSWVLLRGRCRHCGVRLGLFYPAIELMAVVVAAWALIAVPGWLVLPTAFLGWILLALAVIDWREMILPDVLTYQVIAVGLGLGAVASVGVPVDQVIGAATGGVMFAAISIAYERGMQREGLGLGDAKLFAGAGAWVGWQGLPTVLLIGAASGLAAALAAALRSGGRNPIAARRELPFGPWLALGMWLTWLYGPLEIG